MVQHCQEHQRARVRAWQAWVDSAEQVGLDLPHPPKAGRVVPASGSDTSEAVQPRWTDEVVLFVLSGGLLVWAHTWWPF